ncbi:hypothetical protein [Rathayibacter sp. AY2B9]|nr:hypothetical protein [Rathayibacter sp. AY2B9]
MTEPEPIGFDSFGAPIYAWSIGARINDDTRRRLLDAIDEDKA